MKSLVDKATKSKKFWRKNGRGNKHGHEGSKQPLKDEIMALGEHESKILGDVKGWL